MVIMSLQRLLQTICCSSLALGCLLLSSCGASPAASDQSALAAPTTAPGAVSLDKPQGKLSATLAKLAVPALATQSAADQAQALGMPASGPGSLNHNDQGEVLVVARLADTGDATQTALRQAGATIVNVAANYRTVTLYIAPERLQALADLAVVENVREELRAS